MKSVLITKVFLLATLLFFINKIEGIAQCSTPTNLHVTNLTPTSGLFVWNNSTNSTGYALKVRPVGSSYWRRLNSGNNSETVTGLLPNTNYQAKVRSNCSGVESNYSAYYNFVTPSNNPCALPNVYYFTSDNITANSCLVGWRGVSGATEYNVRYRIRYSNSAWLTGTSTTRSLQLNGLTPHTQYEFQVQTVCSSGSAPFSTSGIFTTLISLCSPPSGLSASNVTDSTADLMWNTLPCALYYNVDIRTGGGSWASDTTSLTNLPEINLTSGAAYEFRVQGVLPSGGLTAYSQVYSFTTSSSSCGQPANLNTSSVSTNGATLDWSAVPGAVSYSVRYRLAGASSWQTLSSTTSSVSVTGLSPDNAYEFQVQSICSSGTGAYSITGTFITPPNTANNIPVPDHIVIVMFENKAYTQLLGGSLTPHINALASDPKSAVFIESYGNTHPSQPNYLHLFSGSNQGITNNNLITQKFTTPNLARELINAGETFTSYCEGLPSVGFDGYSSGRYQRKHNPVANWMGTGTNQVSSTLNQPFSSFPTNFDNLPTVSFVVPNMDNSMHDGTLGTALALGDNWFYNNLNAYVQWAKTHNSLLILTTDEDDGSHSNRILTIITGQMVAGGVYSQSITHHSVLRTIAEMYGLNFIGGAASVTPIHSCWTNGFREAAPGPVTEQTISEDRSGWKIYPNPSRGELHVAYELTEDADVSIRIYNGIGGLVYDKKQGKESKGKHQFDLPSEQRLSTGVYFVSVNYGDKKYIQRFLISE